MCIKVMECCPSCGREDILQPRVWPCKDTMINRDYHYRVTSDWLAPREYGGYDQKEAETCRRLKKLPVCKFPIPREKYWFFKCTNETCCFGEKHEEGYMRDLSRTRTLMDKGLPIIRLVNKRKRRASSPEEGVPEEVPEEENDDHGESAGAPADGRKRFRLAMREGGVYNLSYNRVKELIGDLQEALQKYDNRKMQKEAEAKAKAKNQKGEMDGPDVAIMEQGAAIANQPDGSIAGPVAAPAPATKQGPAPYVDKPWSERPIAFIDENNRVFRSVPLRPSDYKSQQPEDCDFDI